MSMVIAGAFAGLAGAMEGLAWTPWVSIVAATVIGAISFARGASARPINPAKAITNSYDEIMIISK